ncbi:type IV secretion system DNA-binding domain-containing protein [Dickeya sp. NCPPB 3274]|uniref:type IV secretion system DNA-binding domain-containing protein n=1 Tax=Dickeya sp. NCPPB 3274 TaxID=568766 RepID=UPI00039B4D49|nr:type IV secretion system DNA-binding domain-containing protein [Dickeya sp. NCPPB 3274]
MLNKKKENGTIVDVTRGGQTLSHFLRMLFQIVTKYTKIVMVVYITSTVIMTLNLTSDSDVYYGGKYAISSVRVYYNFGADRAISLDLPTGEKVQVSHRQIASSQAIKQHYETLIDGFIWSAKISALLATLVAYALFIYLKRRGRKDAGDEHRRGAQIEEKEILKKLVGEKLKAEREPSLYNICGIPLLPEQECTGIMTIGSPSVGKSNAHRDIYNQAREQNHKAMIYDVGGEFIKRFYRHGHDVILSPFDERSYSWSLWGEGKNEITYNRIAESAIPLSDKGDPFWTMGPQIILSSLLDELGQRYREPKVEHLMNIILRMDDKKLASVLAHSDARTIFNIDVEKMAGSLRSVITTYTRGLKYLSLMKGPDFSFKQWLHDDEDRRWVFIPTRDDMKKTLKEIHTMWIETACSTILSLDPEIFRRIILGLDELPNLYPIKSLLDVVDLGRKQGVVPIIGAQSDSQLRDRYGNERSKALADSMGVFMGFRINGKDGAKWVAEQLGNNEVEEAAENYTVSASDTRDATNVHKTPRERTLMLYSQIQNLDNRECILKLGRGLPVVKLEYEFKTMPTIAPAFIDIDEMVNGNLPSKLEYDNALNPDSVLKGIFNDAKANNIESLLSWESQRKNSEEDKKKPEGDGVPMGNIEHVKEQQEEKEKKPPQLVKPLDIDIGSGD